MDNYEHTLPELFVQLGLPAGETGIRKFLAQHAPLPMAMALSEAPFWSRHQAEFLREQWLEDATWTRAIEDLNRALRIAPEAPI